MAPTNAGGRSTRKPAPVRRTTEHRPGTGAHPPLEVVRSTARRRSANAYARDGVIVVQLPAGLPSDEEERLVGDLVRRVTGRQRADDLGGDDELAARAAKLADRHLDGVRPSSIAWSARMQRRYGSCTPDDGTIRISGRIAAFPGYVRDLIILHELAHLIQPDHSKAFHALLDRYPHRAKAEGFLQGLEFAETQPTHPEQADDVGD